MFINPDQPEKHVFISFETHINMTKVLNMPKEIRCKKTRDEIYWRERCIDIIMLNIPEKYHEIAYAYYLSRVIFRTEKLEKVYDELIEELAKTFDLKIVIE